MSKKIIFQKIFVPLGQEPFKRAHGMLMDYMQKRAGVWRVGATAGMDVHDMSAALLDNNWLPPSTVAFAGKASALQSYRSSMLYQDPRSAGVHEGTVPAQTLSPVKEYKNASAQTEAVACTSAEISTQTEQQDEDTNPPEHWELV